MLAAAGKQPADVEQVVRGVLGEHSPVVAALLDHALEQDEQPGDRRTGLQQRFPRRVVAYAEGLPRVSR